MGSGGSPPCSSSLVCCWACPRAVSSCAGKWRSPLRPQSVVHPGEQRLPGGRRHPLTGCAGHPGPAGAQCQGGEACAAHPIEGPLPRGGLAVDRDGKVLSSDLQRRVAFDAVGADGSNGCSRKRSDLVRGFDNPDTQVLGKQLESELIYQDLIDDAADRVLHPAAASECGGGEQYAVGTFRPQRGTPRASLVLEYLFCATNRAARRVGEGDHDLRTRARV